MVSGVQTGASFHSLIFFNNILIPSLIVILGCQLKCALILDISAKDLSGSPGLFGILTLFPPIISATEFIDVSCPLATL